MKRAVFIVAAVTGYCLLEVVVFFCFALPRTLDVVRGVSFGIELLLIWSLLIPGLPALYSIFINGTYYFGRRALGYAALGLAMCPISLWPIVVLILLFPVLMASEWWPDISTALFFLVLAVAASSVGFGVPWLVRRGQRWSVRHQATLWLAQDETQRDPRERRLRNRAIRLSLWIPSLTVLLVFLFLPEVVGIFSQILQRGATRLTGYQVSVPVTWVVVHHNVSVSSGRSAIYGLAGRGSGRTTPALFKYLEYERADNPYLRIFPLSWWSIATYPCDPLRGPASSDYHRPERGVTAQREFRIGRRSRMVCVEQFSREPVTDEDLVSVECSIEDRLHASFLGAKVQTAGFYKMVSSIVPDSSSETPCRK